MTSRVSYIAFLRAVNVGGRSVPMARAREVLSSAGFTDVATHIQSGNVRVSIGADDAVTVGSATMKVVTTAAAEAAIGQILGAEFGLDIPVLVRTPEQLVGIVETLDRLADPFRPVRARYVYLLPAPVSSTAQQLLATLDHPNEHVQASGSELILWLGGPMHESVLPRKLTGAALTTALGQSTARNATVMRALASKWGSPQVS